MKSETEQFLQQLLDATSPSGSEQPAACVFRERVKDHCDELIRDVHGNTMAVLNPGAPFKFMLAGHVDEIGLMVMHIDKEGFISVGQIGGWDVVHLVGQRVRILSDKGPVPGVIGREPIHTIKPKDREKGVELEDIWIDIGAANKRDAEKAVRVGDPVIIDVSYRRLRGDNVIARGCDDRVGAFVVAEVIRELSKKRLDISVYGVATVQEEVGLRGATTSAYTIHPHAGIAIDVGFATDHPKSAEKRMGEAKLGKGPMLHRGPNINPILEADLEKTAKSAKIPFQLTGEPRATGTDANAMQLCRGGAATALLSIPNRYMHSPVEMVSLKDLDNAVKLLATFLAKHPAERDYRP